MELITLTAADAQDCTYVDQSLVYLCMEMYQERKKNMFDIVVLKTLQKSMMKMYLYKCVYESSLPAE